MQFVRFFAAFVLVLFLAVPALSAPKHATSKPVVRHPAAHKATHPPGNPHMKKNGHPVAAPGARKHHKLL